MKDVTAGCADCFRWSAATVRLTVLHEQERLAWAQKYTALEVRFNVLMMDIAAQKERPTGLLDTRQAAALAHRSVESIYEWASRGWLPRTEIKTRHYYDPADVLEALKYPVMLRKVSISGQMH